MSDVVEINVVVERLKEREEEVRETFHFDTILIFSVVALALFL